MQNLVSFGTMDPSSLSPENHGLWQWILRLFEDFSIRCLELLNRSNIRYVCAAYIG
jgi:hypothetical protein